MQNKKFLSVLGDSISTYKGVSDDASACSSLFYNACFYREPFPLEKTYWQIVAQTLGLTLCVNNSFSGGNLSGREDPDSGVNRVSRLSRDDGTRPDVIIVFMGLNDLGRGIDLNIFADDYMRTLMTIGQKYPDAAVCCVNLPDRARSIRAYTEAFNQAIADAVAEAGENFFVADLFSSRLNNDFYYMNTVDGLHPDEDGMRIIAEVIISAFKSRE